MENKLSIDVILEIPQDERNSIENAIVVLWNSKEDYALVAINAAHEYLELKEKAG